MSQFNYAGESTTEEQLKDEWLTPRWVFDPLNDIFDFTIDVAANKKNTWVHDSYFSIDDDGLKQSWEGHTAFNNPPFTRGQYGDWVDKACLEFLNNSVETAQILPFNPETAAFSGVWEAAHYLVLPKKRIAFEYPIGHPKYGEPSAAKFYSIIALYTYRHLTTVQINSLFSIGRVMNLSLGLHNPR
jgi:phage N-6-adenine-methyltransferase